MKFGVLRDSDDLPLCLACESFLLTFQADHLILMIHFIFILFLNNG